MIGPLIFLIATAVTVATLCYVSILRRRLEQQENLQIIASGNLSKLLDWFAARTQMVSRSWLTFLLATIPPVASFSTVAYTVHRLASTPSVAMTAWICATMVSIASSICALIVFFKSPSRPNL